MQNLSTILTSLSIAAGPALGVERTLEVLKHFMESESSFLRRSKNKVVMGDGPQEHFDIIDKTFKICVKYGL